MDKARAVEVKGRVSRDEEEDEGEVVSVQGEEGKESTNKGRFDLSMKKIKIYNVLQEEAGQ